MTKFTDEVEIDAPTQAGLDVTGPVTGVGAGAQLTTTGTGGRGWEILATGQKASQGKDKLNIRDLGNSQDLLTLTSDGNVGIGTTNPGSKLVVEAPNEAGLTVTGPSTGKGAGLTLLSTSRELYQGWQILATAGAAAQGSGKFNIAGQSFSFGVRASVDYFTITNDGKVGIGTINPGFKLEINAPDQLGLRVTGPNPGIGAGISLHTVDPSLGVINRWEILATGHSAAQGSGCFNIRDLATGEDIFTIKKDGVGTNNDAIGIGTTTPTHKLEVNGDVLAANFFMSSSREIKDNVLALCAEEALEAFERLHPVKFNYETEDAKNVHMGFIAEDVPELAATCDRKAVSIMDIVAILTRVVKEQQKTIKALVERDYLQESAMNGVVS